MPGDAGVSRTCASGSTGPDARPPETRPRLRQSGVASAKPPARVFSTVPEAANRRCRADVDLLRDRAANNCPKPGFTTGFPTGAIRDLQLRRSGQGSRVSGRENSVSKIWFLQDGSVRGSRSATGESSGPPLRRSMRGKPLPGTSAEPSAFWEVEGDVALPDQCPSGRPRCLREPSLSLP